MADFYKSAAQAGREARRRGQGVTQEDGSLQFLIDAGREGAESVKSAPRTAISAPSVPSRPISSGPATSGPVSNSSLEERLASIASQSTAAGYEALIPESAPNPVVSDAGIGTDILTSIGSGAVGLGQGVYEIGNLVTGGYLDKGIESLTGTSVSRGLQSAQQYLQSKQSAELQAQRQELQAAEGFWDSFTTVLTNPRLLGSMVLEQVPQLATVAGATRAVVAKTLTSATSRGMTTEAAQALATQNATRTVLGLNALTEAGSAGADARNDIMTMAEAELSQSPQYQKLLQQYGDTEQGRIQARARLANDASALSAAIAAPVSIAASKLTGAAGLEARVFTKGMIGQEGAKRGAIGVARDIGVAGLKEIPEESIQEGGAQFAKNVGVQQTGKPGQDLLEGVSSAAGVGGAVGMAAGAGFGGAGQVRSALKGNVNQPEEPGTQEGLPPGQTAPMMADEEFQSILSSESAPRALADLYAISDDDTRAKLDQLVARTGMGVDLFSLSQERGSQERGRDLVANNGAFVSALNQKIDSFLAQPAAGVEQDVPPEQRRRMSMESQAPVDENALDAAMYQQGDREDAAFEAAISALPKDEQDAARQKFAKARAQQGELVPGPTPTVDASRPGQDVLIRGYERAAANLDGLPEGAQRARAVSSAEAMRRDGFAEEQVNQVFGRFLNPQQPAVDNEAPADTGVEVVEATPEDFQQAQAEAPIDPEVEVGTRAALQTNDDFEAAAYVLRRRDQDRGDEVADTDYEQADVDPDVKALADALGVQVFGYKYKGKSKRAQATKGVRTPFGVVLNQDAKEAHLEVFGHEVYHELANRNPAAARQLNREIQVYMDEGELTAKKKALREKYGDEQVDEEIAADAMGMLFKDREFWKQLGRRQPSLLEQIYRVVADLIKNFKGSTSRGAKTAQMITDLDAIRKMMAEFVADTIDMQQTADQNVDEMVDQPSEPVANQDIPNRPATPGVDQESALSRQNNPAVQSGTLQSEIKPEPTDVGTAKPKKMPTAAETKKANEELRNAPYDEGVARRVVEAEVKKKAGRDDNLPITRKVATMTRDGQVVGEVFATDERKPQFFRFNVQKDGRYNYASGPTLRALTSKLPPGTQVEMMDRPDPAQPTLDLSYDGKLANKYKAQVQRIMTQDFTPSQAQATLKDLRSKLSAINANNRKFFKFRKKQQSDVEYIFDAFGLETSTKSNPAAAISKAIEAAQRGDVKARAGLLKVHAAQISDALLQLRMEMAIDGFPDSEIDAIVGPAQESLKAMENETPPQIVEEGYSTEGRTAEDSLDLPGFQFSEGVQAASAVVEEIIQNKMSPIAAVNREMRKPDRQFSFADLRTALALRGMDVSSIDHEVMQWPAAKYSLGAWVRLHGKHNGNYAARDQWYRSYETIRDIYRNDQDKLREFEAEISEDEKRVIDYMRAQKKAVKARRQEEMRKVVDNVQGKTPVYAMVPFDDVELAFPHALFNKYRLQDLRVENADVLAERVGGNDVLPLQALVNGDVRLLSRLWLDDVSFALDARPDLATQIYSGMTAQERAAVREYRQKTKAIISNNLAISERKTYQEMLAGIGGLDRPAFDRFSQAMSVSDVRALPGLLHQAEQVALMTESVSDKKQLGDLLNAYLNQIYHTDEMQSAPVDEISAPQNNEDLPNVSDEEIRAEMDRAAKEGYPIDYATAKTNLLYEKIAAQAAQLNVNEDNEVEDTFEQEQAADAEMQPENQASLTQDVWRYKRGRYSDGPAAATVASHIAEITRSWPSKPNVTVLYNIDQIQDEELRDRILARAPHGDIKGAIDTETGAVYLFSQKLEGLADAEFVLFHELYGHRGLRAFLGDKLNAFLETQYRLNPKVRAEADRQFDDAAVDGQPMSRIESIEEAISDLAAQGQPSFFRGLIGRLVNWLRKNGMDTVADWIDTQGDKQLAYVLSQARRVVRSGRGISTLNGAPSQVLFARNKRDAVEISALRDGKLTGYARYNPITNHWVVYTIHDPQAGTYDVHTVDNFENASGILKQLGRMEMSRDRSTRQNIDPNNLKAVPNFNDVAGWNKFARDRQMQVQNAYLPLMELARWYKANGFENDLENDIKLLEGRMGDVIQRKFEVEYRRPLMRLLGEIGKQGGTVEDIDLFLMARHAEERNKVIKRIAENSQGSGMSTKEANDILASMNNGAWNAYASQLDALGQLIDRMSKDKINYMQETGLISERAASTLNEQYDHYVNLSGNNEEMDQYDRTVLGPKSFSLKQAQIIRATGRGTRAVDVLENTVNSYLTALINGQRARVAQSMLKMLEQNPDPNLVQIEPIKQKKQINLERLNFDRGILKVLGDTPTEESGREVLRDLHNRVEGGSLSIEDALDQLTARLNQAEQRRDISGQDAERARKRMNDDVILKNRLSPDGYVSMVEDNTIMQDPMVVVARINGQPVMMRFKERAKDVVDAITGRNVSETSAFGEAFGAWNRVFSQMVTTWNPIWAAVNGIRDVQTMFANVAADPKTGAKIAAEATAEWKSSFGQAFRYVMKDQADEKNGYWGGFLKSVSRRFQPNPQEEQWLNEFYEDGAATFFLDRENVELKLESMNRTLNPLTLASSLSSAKDSAAYFGGKLQGLGDAVELLTMPMELAPRLAVYKVLRRNGWSRQDAAVYAKEVTVNFNMKGTDRRLRNYFVFFNPAVQGTFRMFQDYSGGKKGLARAIPSARFAAVASGFAVLGMIANMIATAFGGEDEERPGLRKLDTISDYKRATMLVFFPNEYFGAVPLAYGWNVFAVAGTYLMDVWQGRMSPEVAAKKVAAAAVDAFSPIGSGTNSDTFAGSVIKTITPSPLVPVIEMAMNESRFGGPIYKEGSAFSDVKITDAYSHFDNVNPISRKIMQGMAEATAKGNPRYNEALVDVNPQTIDHLISSYLPGLFNATYQLAGWAVNTAEGRDVKDPKIPLVDRLTAKTPENYDKGAVRRVSEVTSTLVKEYNSVDTPKSRRQEIVKQYPGLFTAHTVINGVQNQLKQVSRNLEQIERDPRITDEAKVAYRNKMDKLEKELMNRAVRTAIKSGFRNEVISGKQD